MFKVIAIVSAAFVSATSAQLFSFPTPALFKNVELKGESWPDVKIYSDVEIGSSRMRYNDETQQLEPFQNGHNLFRIDSTGNRVYVQANFTLDGDSEEKLDIHYENTLLFNDKKFMEYSLEYSHCERQDLPFEFDIKKDMIEILDPSSNRTLYAGVVTPAFCQYKEMYLFIVSPIDQVTGLQNLKFYFDVKTKELAYV